MIGAIIGDIVGSRFEMHNLKSKCFDLFTDKCVLTDDSVMSLAVAKSILDSDGDIGRLSVITVANMQEIGRKYPDCGFSDSFKSFIHSDNPTSYGGATNGAAMRVSACGFAGNSIEEVKALSDAVTRVSHDHPDGLKGAEATAVSIFMARQGASIAEIRDYVNKNYYTIDFTLDEIRDTYEFRCLCQESVPQAFEAFYESESFEDAIRNAISIGGDSDTLAAIAGSIAAAYYGVPAGIRERAMTYLDELQLKILNDFEEKYGRADKK